MGPLDYITTIYIYIHIYAYIHICTYIYIYYFNITCLTYFMYKCIHTCRRHSCYTSNAQSVLSYLKKKKNVEELIIHTYIHTHARASALLDFFLLLISMKNVIR